MRSLYQVLVFFALCLTVLVTAKDKHCVECEISDHHGTAVVETWMGRTAINVGDIGANNLYDSLVASLNNNCNDGLKGWCYWPNLGYFLTRYPKPGPKGERPVYGGTTRIVYKVNMTWSSELNRQILIKRVAKTVSDMIKDPWQSPHCYEVQRQAEPYCNIGEMIRINLPAGGNKQLNNIRLTFWGEGTNTVVNSFKCCAHEGMLYNNFMASEIEDSFDMAFSQNARCLIGDGITCKQCGNNCDWCDAHCHDGCMKGKC